MCNLCCGKKKCTDVKTFNEWPTNNIESEHNRKHQMATLIVLK